MTIDKNTGLVLEEGGLRGVFTCGVLDCFMDFKLLFEDFPETEVTFDPSGYEKLVVVLTRNKGYRKKDAKMRAAKVVYHGYSNLSMPGSYGKGYGKAHCIVSGRL